MKKYIFIFLGFIILIFALPAIFTRKANFASSITDKTNISKNTNENNAAEASNNDNEKSNNSGNGSNSGNSGNSSNDSNGELTQEEINKLCDYNYNNYSKIKLLHTKTGQVEEIPLDQYLLGVVSAEMPANFEEEALKAQAVVARTYTLYSIEKSKKHENADVCDSPLCCQAWISKEDRLNKWEESKRNENWGKIFEAVNSTKGKVIKYNGDLIDAFFHSNSGGKTEEPVNVWGGSNYPYLQSVETSGEDAYSQYSSEVILSKDDFVKKIKEKHNNLEINFNKEDAIKITEYTDTNRVKTIKVGNLNLSGVEIRSILGLKSTNFQFSIDGDSIKFEVTGYGHGVGMSQTGADSMAKQGKKYDEIIKHFYTGVEVVDF